VYTDPKEQAVKNTIKKLLDEKQQRLLGSLSPGN
jgi:hypothetical protein